MGEPELEKVNCKFLGHQGKAYILENDEGQRDFFPMSQVSFDRCNEETGEAIAEIPIWILDKKGW